MCFMHLLWRFIASPDILFNIATTTTGLPSLSHNHTSHPHNLPPPTILH